MYFRSAFPDRDEPYRIPENYRGNAFPEATAEPEIQAEDPSIDPPLAPNTPPQAPPEEISSKKETHPPAIPSFLTSLLPPKPHATHDGISGGIGNEEILLLGILLLLSQKNADDDIVLLLLLLLLYK